MRSRVLLRGVRVREIDASKSEVVFLYDLDNKTDTDYQLAKGRNGGNYEPAEVLGKSELRETGHARFLRFCASKDTPRA